MPVITQKFIFRSDLRNNPRVIYLFGDNFRRVGLGGQAKEMRGEPNAVGIATKRAPGVADRDFFTDADMDLFKEEVRRALVPVREHLDKGGLVVIPEDGLGTGLSELPQRAPALDVHLRDTFTRMREHYGW